VSSSRTDARVARSRAALVDAVEDVLDEGRWSDLTIGGLCSRAGVSRPTFYQHFSSPEDLLGATIHRRLDQASAGVCSSADVAELLAAALVGLDQKRHEYACLAAQPAAYAQVQTVFHDWLARRVRTRFPGTDDVAIAYAAGGIARVVGQWLASDADRPDPQELVRRLGELNLAVLDR
jgi:AcrR family transcriptional regulator